VALAYSHMPASWWLPATCPQRHATFVPALAEVDADEEPDAPLSLAGNVPGKSIVRLCRRHETARLGDPHHPKVPPATIAALAEGSWVILIGESGTGKTMLATALGVCACQQGRRVRFTTLAGLATELQEADSRKELARVVGRYSRIEVLALDELVPSPAAFPK
jgi:IstB-like ATP binding protein